MDVDHDAIRALAYELWEKAGYPDGNAEGFWYAAEADLLQRNRKETSREEAEASPLASVGALVVR